MSVKMKKLTDCQVELTIEVSDEQWANALDKAFEKVVKEVKVDGFRPGKMPKSMFIKKFGYASLYEEAVNIALNDTYPAAVAAKKVNIVSQPTIDLDFATINEKTGFKYTAKVDVIPTVTLGQYKELKVKTLSKEVTEADLEQKIEEVLKTKVENVIKETAIENGDIAVIDFEGFTDGVAFEGGKGENYPLEIGSGSFIPGFEEQLIGLKTGDSADVNVVFPEQYHAELAGKPAVFKVTVHEVKNKVAPELNDEFVSELELDGVSTVAEYKEYLKTNIAKEKETAYERDLVNGLLTELVNNTEITLPESMVQYEVEQQVKNVEQQAKQYGMPIEMLLQYYGMQSLEDFKSKIKEQSANSIKQELIFEQIIKTEKIKASKKEVEAKYLEFVKNNQNKEENATTEELVEKAKQNIPSNQIEQIIVNEKVIALLKESAILE